MKRLFFCLPIIAFYLLLASPVFANKCGVNIGPNYSQVSQVKNLTNEGGWIVALGSPGNCSDFESLFGKGLNVIIRAYNGGRKFTNSQALGWVATLGKLDSRGQKIYFMPWNEPNHPEECGGTPCSPEEVKNYVSYLKNQLEDAGLLNSKVVLLSPTIDKLNPTFNNFLAVYGLGLPSSINAYDQFITGPCSAAPPQNNCLYDQIGIPAPYYALETGVAGTCAPWPCYRDLELFQMLNRSWQKWKNDGNFKMFAIFSYDPHRPGNWDIFSASKTKSFYKNNCLPGSLEYGYFNRERFEKWFSQNANYLVSCGGCGYAPSATYCSAAGGPVIKEPVVVKPENSLICNDSKIEYKLENVQTLTPTPTPTPNQRIYGITQEKGMKPFEGMLRLDKIDFPLFSQIEETLSSSLEKLLPVNLKQNFSLDTTPLKTVIKHFVFGEDKDANLVQPESIPETEISQPGWFTKLIGSTKILCSLFMSCPRAKSLNIKVIQPEIQELSNSIIPNTNCGKGINIEGENLEDFSSIRENFKTSSFLTKTIETSESSGGGRIKISESADFQKKTRGYLVGGKTLAEQSLFLNSFLPPTIASPKNFNFKSGADFSLSPDFYYFKGEEVLNYQNLGIIRNFCLQQCMLHPEGTDIHGLYSFCHSCDPNDYIPSESGDDVALDMSLCQKNQDGSCDYYKPGDFPRCDGDPICESGKCYPLMWRQANDYLSQNCPLPYSATNCNNKNVCQLATFQKNPAGGFGACQYSNPNVCVRADRIAIGSCAALCNWSCCSYQR
jgi:hypothetical protein